MSPRVWSLEDFNELLDATDPNETLASAGVQVEDLHELALYGLNTLLEVSGPRSHEDLTRCITAAAVGMFAAGMEMQKYLDKQRDEDDDV